MQALTAPYARALPASSPVLLDDGGTSDLQTVRRSSVGSQRCVYLV